ncbi:MAG: patatin-like phospholipase family protein [Phycisphaerales bacterium]|nr:patatin-like phospholipase family protein [Phycisphaerales bacterium]
MASAAFIAGIEAHTGRPFAGSFDLFCGTSTGAIISLALAYGKSGEELVALYETLGDRVFRRKGRGWLSAKYPSDPLRAVLTEQFGATTLGDLHANRKATLVTALNLTTGTPRVFKTDHSANLSRDNGLRLVDIAMASTAAPTFFPVVRLENPGDRLREEFCDAGVVANHPALLGFVEALEEFKVPPGQVRVLSIATPRCELGEGAASKRCRDRGRVAWLCSRSFPSLFIDSGSMVAHQILRRIVASYQHPCPRYERIEMANPDRLRMDEVTMRSKQILAHCGRTAAADNTVRRRVSSILN